MDCLDKLSTPLDSSLCHWGGGRVSVSIQQWSHACRTDPQVKVVGVPASIQQARELILMDLDAKSTRVTLKIDVAYSEHSHVIGKEGVNIKKGMS